MSVPPHEGLPTGDSPHRLRVSRRWFLVLAGAVVAGLIGATRLDRRGPQRVTPGSLSDFPVLNVEDNPPTLGSAAWVVSVDGLVDKPLRLDRAGWNSLPRTSETNDFHCVEGWSVDRLHWEGVKVADVLSLAVPRQEGRFVTFHAYDGSYSDSLTLAEALAAETLLADTLDSQPLPPEHGGPVRLVVPSQLGYKNVKWVVRLEVTSHRALGYWELERNGGYPVEAPVR